MEGDTVCSVVKNINEYNLDLIEEFFKYIHQTQNNDLINSFKYGFVSIPYGIERFSKLQIVFKSKFIRENMFQHFYNDGVTNEMKGYFTLFNDSPSKGWDVNINFVKPILDMFIDDNESCSKLVKLIKQHLDINISYSYSQHKFININKCSSVKYVSFLVKVMIYIFEKTYFDTHTLSSLERNDYELKDNDDLLTQVVIITLFSIKVGYIPLARIYNTLNKEKIYLQGQISDAWKLNFDRICGIYKDNNFHNSILNFVDMITKYDVFISDDITHNINDFVSGCIIDNEIKILSINIVNYLLKTIHGDYGANKHERFATCTTIIVICDRLGYSFFTNLITVDKNITANLFFAILKIITNVDHFEWTQLQFAHKFYQEMLGMLLYYSDKFDISVIDNDDISHDINLLFHKITSKMNSFITDMAEICRKYVEQRSDISFVRTQYKQLINEYIKSFMSCIQTLQTLIKNNVIEIKVLPIELVLPLSAFSVSLLTLLSNGKNSLYTVFQMNMETLDLMQELFKLINICCQNSNFTESIKDNIDIIKEMVNRVKLDNDLKQTLINYLGNLNNDSDSDDLPEEFIDPILAVEIKNPVMIPKVDQIFDKGTIMSHLYCEETNPLTRDILTIKEFEEYNKRDDVIDKITKFINKFTQYKTNKDKLTDHI